MLLSIEPFEYTPSWKRAIVLHEIGRAFDGPGPRVTEPRAIAFYRGYESLSSDPRYREIRHEVTAMLRGLVGDLEAPVTTFTGDGHYFHKLDLGFLPTGINLGHIFRFSIV
jgi:hypothetical protein